MPATEVLPGLLFFGDVQDGRRFVGNVLDLTVRNHDAIARAVEVQQRRWCVPIPDMLPIERAEETLTLCAEIIFQSLRTTQPILVHCGLGRNRSAAVVTFFLKRYIHADRSIDRILGDLKRARPNISIIPALMRQLQDLLDGDDAPPSEELRRSPVCRRLFRSASA